jgi:GT2 family glycosyltransferase
MDNKRIMIFAPVHQREWILPYYLRNLANINYEKKLIRILWVLNNTTDNSLKLLQEFKDNHSHKYESIDIQIWDNPKVGLDLRSTEQRIKFSYQWLADLRNRGVEECLKQECDYLFSCDSDILVKDDIIHGLIEINKPFVAGLIYNGYEYAPSTFWEFPNILRLDGNNYRHINNYYTKNKTGVIKCDFSGALYLASKEALPHMQYGFHKMGEDLPACQSLQKAGFELFVSCEHYSQHVMSSKWLKEFKNFGFEEEIV